MKLHGFAHRAVEEDYAYLSGFLKAREVRFLKAADYTTLSRLMTLQELIDILPKFGYRVSNHGQDPVVFEGSLWKNFLEELSSMDRLEPEPFLVPYLDAFRKILFWKSDDQVFSSFITLSKNGTDLTKELARLVVDRFNFFEKIRALHDKSTDWHFEKEGHFSQETIDQLFDSSFQSLDLSINYAPWKHFIDIESPIKEFNFDFTTRLDTYWKSIMETSFHLASYQTYGLDYCISYFVKWILEMEAITKVYFTLRFGLHYDLREELYLHVR
jgi:hypothetical protein